jgi:hypothetical protein
MSLPTTAPSTWYTAQGIGHDYGEELAIMGLSFSLFWMNVRRSNLRI